MLVCLSLLAHYQLVIITAIIHYRLPRLDIWVPSDCTTSKTQAQTYPAICTTRIRDIGRACLLDRNRRRRKHMAKKRRHSDREVKNLFVFEEVPIWLWGTTKQNAGKSMSVLSVHVLTNSLDLTVTEEEESSDGREKTNIQMLTFLSGGQTLLQPTTQSHHQLLETENNRF